MILFSRALNDCFLSVILQKLFLFLLLLNISLIGLASNNRSLTYHYLVDDRLETNPSNGVFQTVNEALLYVERFQFENKTDSNWTEIRITPSVYWIDDPNDTEVRRPKPGNTVPFGLEVKISKVKLKGLGSCPEETVLASNRGQTQGAEGNFTMFHFIGDSIEVENLTFGNYCNVDLEYSLDSNKCRVKRADAIVQAQLIICHGDAYKANNCRFISRLNLCPFAGAERAEFTNCYFECTDDALCGTGIYNQCKFVFYSSKPFYCTSVQGALFVDCDLHTKVRGTQFLTKVSDPVTMRNCRWTSDDPNLKIEWTKKPNPIHLCIMEGCTLNGKDLYVPPTPQVPMPFGITNFDLSNCPDIRPGKWTIDAYKPQDTYAYNWQVDSISAAWCFSEGIDGAEGIYGLMQNSRGARLMYTGLAEAQYKGQQLAISLAPCKSAGQGFGSATGQYLDVCVKFDPSTLSGYGIRFTRTPQYDNAIDVLLVAYKDGEITQLTEPQKCVLYKAPLTLVLTADHINLKASIRHEEKEQILICPLPYSNSYGGLMIQHTGSVGASATLITSLQNRYFEE